MNQNELVEYGIQTEKSDVRVHVCVKAQKAYVYKTVDGNRAIQNGNYPLAPTVTNDTLTAKGYLVPPEDIAGIQIIYPGKLFEEVGFYEAQTTTEKGNCAVNLVAKLLEKGDFPLHKSYKKVNNKDMQIDGVDIEIYIKGRIQVKCDWNGGIGPGCTGNLYIQVAEANPLNNH